MEFNVLMDFLVELSDSQIIEVHDEDELILKIEEFIESLVGATDFESFFE